MKKFLFTLITFGLVLLLLLLGEGLLRLAGYGTDYPLFIEKNGRWHSNPRYAEKFFSSRDINIPELIDQQLPAKKAQNVWRIVALGGSTTAGFPFEVSINFPYFIKNRLQQLNPGKRIELINLGISAVNSFTVADMTDQVVALQPDLVLLYMGHNEFYGALGPASTQAISAHRGLIRLTLWLREWRLYQWLRALLESLAPPAPAPQENRSLMSQMIGKARLMPDDPLYKATLQNFSANLESIINDFHTAGIPLIISDLVSNLRDQYPLGETAETEDALLKKARQQDPQTALQTIRPLLNQQPVAASVAWFAARRLQQLNRNEEARRYFIMARDNDPMPFRAPSAINRIIDSLARVYHIPKAPTRRLFNAYSTPRAPGNTLFLEHLHPRPMGYALIARSFLQTMDTTRLIALNCHDTLDAKAFLNAQPFTLFDQRIGEMKVSQLMNGFPFNGRSQLTPTPADSMVNRLASRHLHQGLYWDGAHFQLGDYYLQNQNYQKALREYNAVYANDPENPSALYRLGDVYTLLKEYDKAETFYNTALNITPGQAYLYAKLGRMRIIREQTDAGIAALETVIKLEKNKKTLNNDDMKTLYYLLGVGYARKGLYRKADAACNLSIHLDPLYDPPLTLKNKIRLLQGKTAR